MRARSLVFLFFMMHETTNDFMASRKGPCLEQLFLHGLGGGIVRPGEWY